MPIDEWTRAAATDDALVADLLLRLKYATEVWTPTMAMAKAEMVSDSLFGGLAWIRWGLRKARSRTGVTGVTRCVMDKECKKRATRSPTTPLSWSGGSSMSASGNADGFEASSMMRYRSPPRRSKACFEIKEDRGSLLEESKGLKRGFSNLRANLADRRVTNENSKRIKRMNVQTERMTASTVAENQFVFAQMQENPSRIRGMPSLTLPPHESKSEIPLRPPASMSFYDAPATKDKGPVMLPDLNVLPSIDEEPF